MNDIKQKVYNFETKNKQGFVRKEIDILLEDYPEINMDQFNDALTGITGMMINNEYITYHCDVEKALRCGIENRRLKTLEWD